jgi:hypothetical protein
MPRLLAALLLAAATTVAVAAAPADLGIKPGLWELKLIKQVIDGRDLAAQLQAALAKLPAEQRSRMEAAMREHSGSGNFGEAGSTYRVCISPEMAHRELPPLDKEGRCKPANYSRTGNSVNFEYSCTSAQGTMTGKGLAVIAGDLVTTRTDMTSTDPKGGHHAMQAESEMRFIGADCGNVKPVTPPN